MSKKSSNQQQAKQSKLNIIQADDFRNIYANWIQTAITPFDISMTVGQVTPSTKQVAPSGGTHEFDVIQTARITFAPAEAKLATAMLFKIVSDWERTFGKIVIPPHAIPPGLLEAMKETIENNEQQADVQDKSETEGE